MAPWDPVASKRKKRCASHIPAKEKYLADDEFAKVFGMSKDAFEGQAKWKKDKLKKEQGLF